MSATLPKRFPLGLTLQRWRRILAELLAMESDHGAHGTVPVEKQLERARAGEQLLIFVRYVVEESGPPVAADGSAIEPTNPAEQQTVERELPLSRSSAKYLLTACDRLRRAALKGAWQQHGEAQPAEIVANLLDEARLWDHTMRDLSHQSGVIHPLAELVAPLSLGESELAKLGLHADQLLNGQDLLAV